MTKNNELKLFLPKAHISSCFVVYTKEYLFVITYNYIFGIALFKQIIKKIMHISRVMFCIQFFTLSEMHSNNREKHEIIFT